MRRINVRRKLNAMALEFSGKNVLIVDGNMFLLKLLEVSFRENINSFYNFLILCIRFDC